MAMDPLPVMNKVFSLVLQFEREFIANERDIRIQEMSSVVRKGYNGQSSDNNGNQFSNYNIGTQLCNSDSQYTGNNGSNGAGSYFQGQPFSNKKQNFQNFSQNKIQCSFCKGNHLVVNCGKKNGYPPNFKSNFSRVNVVTSL